MCLSSYKRTVQTLTELIFMYPIMIFFWVFQSQLFHLFKAVRKKPTVQWMEEPLVCIECMGKCVVTPSQYFEAVIS